MCAIRMTVFQAIEAGAPLTLASRPLVSRRGTQRRKKAQSAAAAAKLVHEEKLAFQMHAANLPAFVRQLAFIPGRKFTADFAWPELRLVVEVQGGIWRRGGGAHSHPTAILRDIEKSQLAVINGWSVFPVTTDEVTSGHALRLIEFALQSKGWKP